MVPVWWGEQEAGCAMPDAPMLPQCRQESPGTTMQFIAANKRPEVLHPLQAQRRLAGVCGPPGLQLSRCSGAGHHTLLGSGQDYAGGHVSSTLGGVQSRACTAWRACRIFRG